MSSIIVYCQADEKICVGSGEFSTLYRGSRLWEVLGCYASNFQKDPYDTAVIIMSN